MTGSSSSPISAPKTINPCDPYFVHPADNPTSVLVQPILNGDNYNTWVRGMTKALSAKAKLGFVNGVLPEPSSILDEENYNNWKRADDLVSSWICHSTTNEIKKSVECLSSSMLVWKDLKERFSQTSAPKLFQLKQSIASLKQTDQSLSAHYTELRSLWDEIDSIRPLPQCICGASKQTMDIIDQDRAMEFLQSLHERFSSLRSNILQRDTFPSVRTIHNLVRQEEVQQEMYVHSMPSVDAAALQVSRSDSKSSSFLDTNKRSKYFCDHCKIHGHTKSRCFKLIGYPPRNNNKDRPYVAASMSDNAHAPARDAVMPSFTHDQYRGLLSLLQNSNGDLPPSVNLTGPIDEEGDWLG